MRGKLQVPLEKEQVVRITPARAGKTPLPELPAGLRRDHPRVCGENLKRAVAIRECAGSPPRVRGKRVEAIEYARGERITPACAGKTFC